MHLHLSGFDRKSSAETEMSIFIQTVSNATNLVFLIYVNSGDLVCVYKGKEILVYAD